MILLRGFTVLLVAVFTLVLSGCSESVRPVYEYKDDVIDFMVVDSSKPFVKEIILGGADHSREELVGLIKVRVSGRSVRYMNDSFLGWWSDFEDKKTYEMSRIEEVIGKLRISDRASFINKHIDEDIIYELRKKVLSDNVGSLSKIENTTDISDNIGVFSYGNIGLNNDIVEHINTVECSTKVSPMSYKKSFPSMVPSILRIASEQVDFKKFNKFYSQTAEIGLLKEKKKIEGMIAGYYQGQHFDVEKECNDDFSIQISETTNIHGTVTLPVNLKSIRLTEVDNNSFNPKVTIDSLTVIAGYLNIDNEYIDGLGLSIDRGVLRISNVTDGLIEIKSITPYFNGDEYVNHYKSKILPGSYLDFHLTSKKHKDFYTIRNYTGGSIDASIKINHITRQGDGEMIIDLDVPEVDVWTQYIFPLS